MLRGIAIAAALLCLTANAWAAGRTSSWSSGMRLTPKPPPLDEELRGNCAGLTVTIKTRIERLKSLQETATQQQWPPPTATTLWAKRPAAGDIGRQRERIARLNAALGAKGCQTVDVETELRRAPARGAGARTK